MNMKILNNSNKKRCAKITSLKEISVIKLNHAR